LVMWKKKTRSVLLKKFNGKIWQKKSGNGLK
jgi:hypothetical protein